MAGLADPRVCDGIERGASFVVAEHDFAELFAIESAVSVDYVGAESLGDLGEGWRAGLDDLASQLVCVDQRGAELAQQAGHCALSAGNAASESEDPHVLDLPRMRCRLVAWEVEARSLHRVLRR